MYFSWCLEPVSPTSVFLGAVSLEWLVDVKHWRNPASGRWNSEPSPSPPLVVLCWKVYSCKQQQQLRAKCAIKMKNRGWKLTTDDARVGSPRVSRNRSSVVKFISVHCDNQLKLVISCIVVDVNKRHTHASIQIRSTERQSKSEMTQYIQTNEKNRLSCALMLKCTSFCIKKSSKSTDFLTTEKP